jgi:hypothetical protein
MGTSLLSILTISLFKFMYICYCIFSCSSKNKCNGRHCEEALRQSNYIIEVNKKDKR